MDDSIVLERLRYAAEGVISGELADQFGEEPSVEVYVVHDWMRSIAMRVTQEIYGRTLEKVEVEYPADWWQAFKERWFPAWATRRWPVRWTRVRLEATELCPQLKRPDSRLRLSKTYQ